MRRFWLVVTLALGVAVRAGGQTPRASAPQREVSPRGAEAMAPTATPPFPRATPTTAPTGVPKPKETPLPTYTESAGSEYVLMPVLVFDPKGRFIDDLQKKDFRVQAGGVKVDL